MSYAEIVSEDGCFELCYAKTRTRYGVHAGSGTAVTLGPDCVEYDGWARSHNPRHWPDYKHPSLPAGIWRRWLWDQ
jgi:hypothetical protein